MNKASKCRQISGPISSWVEQKGFIIFIPGLSNCRPDTSPNDSKRHSTIKMMRRVSILTRLWLVCPRWRDSKPRPRRLRAEKGKIGRLLSSILLCFRILYRWNWEIVHWGWYNNLPMTTSVEVSATRLGYFWKILASKLRTKDAQIFGDFSAYYFEKSSFGVHSDGATFSSILGGKMGYFLFLLLVTLNEV